jgi:hypothetical protein
MGIRKIADLMFSNALGLAMAYQRRDVMRDELMTEALCWELEERITADYAHAVQAAGNFAFYCPHEICLAKVHARAKVNTYFQARDRHVEGCPDEARASESSLRPGEPKPRPAQVLKTHVPNLLGPQSKLKPKSRTPTRDELLQLSRAVRNTPALHPGTRDQVVDAWVQMTPTERASQALTIGSHRLTYESAFTFARDLGHPCDITSLSPDRIIFGAATVRIYQQRVVFIESKRKFAAGETEVPLRLSVDLAKAPSWLIDLVGKQVTLFWHGETPTLASTKNGYQFKVNLNSPYVGITLRLGELTP